MTESTSETLESLAAAINGYFTCEFATITASGVPIAWPTVSLFDQERGLFTVTTSIGLPRKAMNVRRDPHVAMLFSDPTGSGRRDPQVLVQGTAVVSDDVVTSPAGLERYWARLFTRQPAGTSYGRNSLSRRLFDWYYMRLVITVQPVNVHARAPLDASSPLRVPKPARGDRDAYSQAARRLPAYSSGVLATIDESGFPGLQRVVMSAEPEDRALLLDVPVDAGLREGRASLLCHAHDERLWRLRSFVVSGTLAVRDERWALLPDRFVPGAPGNDPVAAVRGVRGMRHTASSYLATRSMPRPQIPWGEYEPLKK